MSPRGRRTRDATGERQETTLCGSEACGAELDSNGWCPRGGGYPRQKRNPETCPTCRKSLDWDGGCPRCYGIGLNRQAPKAMTFPGRRYRFQGDHWVMVDGRTTRGVCTPAENRRALQIVLGLLEHRCTEGEARERLADLFQGRELLDAGEQEIEDEREAELNDRRAGRGEAVRPITHAAAWEPGASG